jgi:hypothetical protein
MDVGLGLVAVLLEQLALLVRGVVGGLARAHLGFEAGLYCAEVGGEGGE